jgi:hypothetical protein
MLLLGEAASGFIANRRRDVPPDFGNLFIGVGVPGGEDALQIVQSETYGPYRAAN